MTQRDFIAIGTSSGGVDALQMLVSQLPPGFPAAVAIVLHIGAHPSILPSLLTAAGPLPAAHARDGEAYVPGRIYVAPPDRHLIVDGTRLRLVISAKENFARPAIDPLMRSVAIERGTRAIGVILTGQLDDGAAGLEALRKCGGATIVQDPGDAFAGDMPRHAVPFADHVLRLAAIAPRLVELTQSSSARPRPHAPPMRDGHARLRLEQHAASGPSDALQTLSRFASPSLFTCPECSGALWRISGSRMLRYRCHTGHAYSWASLAHGRADDVERTLMEALRALHERQQMSETLGEHFGRTGELVAQQHEENTARRAAEAAGVLRTILAAS